MMPAMLMGGATGYLLAGFASLAFLSVAGDTQMIDLDTGAAVDLPSNLHNRLPLYMALMFGGVVFLIEVTRTFFASRTPTDAPPPPPVA
jgi:hypothetical protein